MLQTIARMLGWAPPPAPDAAPRIADITAAAPPGLAVVRGGDIGMPVPMLDPDALAARNRAYALALARRNCREAPRIRVPPLG